MITFRCYGTWLHGDERGSVNRTMPRKWGDPFIPPTPGREAQERASQTHECMALTAEARAVVERTIAEVCEHRGWTLHAVNARSNHIHIVVAAFKHPPERVMNDFKAWSTRRLVEARLVVRGDRVWSRHGSTIYLWNPGSLREKIDYVVNGQLV